MKKLYIALLILIWYPTSWYGRYLVPYSVLEKMFGKEVVEEYDYIYQSIAIICVILFIYELYKIHRKPRD